LVVLVAVAELDVLASTALVLAILAFLIQIVIFVAQFWMSSERTRQTATSQSETTTILAGVARTQDETVALVRGFISEAQQRKSAASDTPTVTSDSLAEASLAARQLTSHMAITDAIAGAAEIINALWEA